MAMKTILILNFLWFASVIAYSPEENQYTRTNQLIEGDIKIMPEQMRGSRSARLWPNGVFVYDIEPSLAQYPDAKKGIRGAMKAWNEKTNNCIKFIKRTTETAYVSFFRGNGCWSYVGRIGIKQQLSLGFGCWRHGTIAHEIGHALGFLHEQSRLDRDNYVKIKFDNIRAGAEDNFRKSYSDNSMGTPYDYGSIMHYGAKFFSKNDKSTIVTTKPGFIIGQREGLSPIDVDEMMKLYGCTSIPTHPPVQGSFQCTFDGDLCGFNQENDDEFDWTRGSKPTPSRGTGPGADHTGGGSFMYIETSRPRIPGDNAKLSRMITLTGKSCLKFYSHMYGDAMGTLKVKHSDRVIFEESGNQGNQWNMHDIRLEGSGSTKLTFEAIKGSGWTGDAAIDDVTIYDCQ